VLPRNSLARNQLGVGPQVPFDDLHPGGKKLPGAARRTDDCPDPLAIRDERPDQMPAGEPCGSGHQNERGLC
jgi:hypothetical protein